MHKIIPFLWFDKETEEAINFYISVFNGSPNKIDESRIINITRYEKGMGIPGRDDMTGKSSLQYLSLTARDLWLWMAVLSLNSTKRCLST